MMKNNKNILSLMILFVVLFMGCQKSALELAPLDRLSSGSFWKTESDAQSALTACYAFMKNNSTVSTVYTPIFWEGLTDNGYVQYGNMNIKLISQSGPTPTIGGLVNDVYSSNYRAIAVVNQLLTNITSIEMPEATKNKIIAEAKFLRAYFYYQLATTYGNVIIISEPATDSFKESRVKSTRAEVFSFINKDLDDAIEILPDVAYTDGHAVKGSAQALKSRALLYERKFVEAAKVAKDIIDANKFKLSTDFSTIFYKPGQTNNTEIIFSIKNMAPNSFPAEGADLVIGTWQTIQPTADLVETFEAIDGLPISQSKVYNAANPYENRDPRLKKTFFVGGEDQSKGWMNYDNKVVFVPSTGINTTGFATRKGLDPSVNNPTYGSISTQDHVLIRYAEVLLNYAEAENEVNGPVNAYAAINAIRSRAGMPALAEGLSKDQMREKIRQERRVELAMEGFRYFDLRRWGIATEKLNNFEVVKGNTNLNKLMYNPIFDYWPLPQTDIDRNPSLIQNPGY